MFSTFSRLHGHWLDSKEWSAPDATPEEVHNSSKEEWIWQLHVEEPSATVGLKRAEFLKISVGRHLRISNPRERFDRLVMFWLSRKEVVKADLSENEFRLLPQPFHLTYYTATFRPYWISLLPVDSSFALPTTHSFHFFQWLSLFSHILISSADSH